MKANKGQVERAFDGGGTEFTLTLLYGPDEAGSRAVFQRLVRAMGPDAEKVELDGPTLKADVARLSDEAASFSLFGGKRYIVATISGEEALPAVEALLGNGAEGNPVVLLAGDLKKTSGLLKRLLGEPKVACLASYVPNESDMVRIAQGIGQEQGLRLDQHVGRRLVHMAGSDRAILSQEIAKMALYLDASPASPRELGHDAIDAVAADSGEPDLSRLTDLVFGGRPEALAEQLAGLAAEGIEGIALLRALNKRVHLLIKLSGEVACGKSIDAAVEPIFFKERAAVAQQLRRWPPERLEKAASRILESERAIKSSRSAGAILAENEMLMISRAAKR